MDALAAMHGTAVQMIDTSVVRVHQHGACIAGNDGQHMGRSRGGLTTKIHAVVNTNGLPVQLGLTPGEAHDNRLCSVLLSELRLRTMLLADRGYDAGWFRALASDQGAWANIPPKRNRKEAVCFSPYLYRARNLVERFFNRSSNVGVSQLRLPCSRARNALTVALPRIDAKCNEQEARTARVSPVRAALTAARKPQITEA